MTETVDKPHIILNTIALSLLGSIKKHKIGILIFFISLLIGLIVFDNYGISWDEREQRDIGMHAYDYAFQHENNLKNFNNSDYGVAFELPLILEEKALKLDDTRSIYLTRHLTSHLFFLLGAFIFYLLIYYLTNEIFLAVIGYLLLLINPLIYAHSFYNTKDVPFMVMFIISFFLAFLAFKKRGLAYFILLGISTGLLINLRIMGIIIVPILAVFFIADLIFEKGKKKTITSFILYIFFLLLALISTWPYLWKSPVVNFIKAFKDMSKFRWDGTILMFGHLVRSTALSWTYIPIWFAITNPITYLIIGIIGLTILLASIVKNPVHFIKNTPDRNQLLYLGIFLGSLLAVIVFHSVLYDGWRQMFYIYPPFILIGIFGLQKLSNIKASRYFMPIIIAVLLIDMSGVTYFMVKSHPFQGVYFNALISKKEQHLRKNFEMDYWGTSYKQALEFILKNDDSKSINIMVANMPGMDNLMIIPKKDRARVKYVSNIKDTDYFVSNYRTHPEDYPYPAKNKVFNIKIENSDIMTVWKLSR